MKDAPLSIAIRYISQNYADRITNDDLAKATVLTGELAEIQVANVFAGSKKALPWLTVAMLTVSGMVRSYGLLVLLALGVAALVGRQALKNEAENSASATVYCAWILLISRLAMNSADWSGHHHRAASLASSKAAWC